MRGNLTGRTAEALSRIVTAEGKTQTQAAKLAARQRAAELRASRGMWAFDGGKLVRVKGGKR